MNTVFLNKPNQYQENLNGFILKLGFILLLCCNNVFAGNINLAWDPSPSTGVGGYKLYYGSSSKTYSQNIDVGNKTSYTMTGLTDGATYYVSLKAYNTAKSIESSYSNEVSAKVVAATTTTTNWTLCASEWQTCSVSGTRQVRYGTSTTFITGVASGSLPCNNIAFGKDPAIAQAKQCWVSSSTTTAAATVPVSTTATWTVCAKEWTTCTVSGQRQVRYGTSTTFITGVASGSVPCNNIAFGKDPAYAQAKQCWVSSIATTAAITVPVSSTNSANAIASTTTTSSTPTTATSVNGLVAAYGFDDFGGAITADASGLGNHAVITGATRTASGYSGNALQFNGTSDWVTVNDSASLDLTSGMTLEAWVKPAATMSGWKTILMKEQLSDEVYSLYANNNENTPVTGQWISGSVRPLAGISSLTANTWKHVVATYDGQTQRLYLNGVQVSQRAQTGVIQTSSSALRIGGNSIFGEYFNGLIDEVRVYNRALTVAEVQANFKTSVSASKPAKIVLGDKTLNPYVDMASQGRAQAFKTTSQVKSVVTALQAYLDAGSTATELWAGIYSDNAGHPGALITQGKVTSPKAGATNTVPINATVLEAAKPYWIALLGSKGDIKFRIRTGSTVPTEMCATTGLTQLPGQWTPGNVAPNDGPMSAYGIGY